MRPPRNGMTNLTNCVANAAAKYGDSTAIHYESESTSYESLWDQIGRFAAGLTDQGIGVDDRVALYLPNVPEFVVAFYGTLRVGGTVVPMNPQYKSREVEYLLSDSDAKVVVTQSELVPQVTEVMDKTSVENVVSTNGSPKDTVSYKKFVSNQSMDGVVSRNGGTVAVQPYTSGTTGDPKGVLLTHSNLVANVCQAEEVLPGGIQPTDKQFGILPLFHIYGMTWLMNLSLFNGATYYPIPEWEPAKAASLINDEDLTLFHAVPTMYNDLVNDPNSDIFDLSSLRACSVGGSSLPREVHLSFEDRHGVRIYDAYGLTETSPTTHANTSMKRRIGSIGQPVRGVKSMIVTDDFDQVPPVPEGPLDDSETDLNDVTGEIVVSGPNVMKGYYDLPDATQKAFTEADGTCWFHTGDIGYHDEEGYYYIVDREKYVIITGGYNVYPREVEELLYEHNAVTEAAVTGIPDSRRGETVKAFIVPSADSSPSEEEIRNYCLANLAAYKHPREVEFVDRLPRTATGKVKKYELSETSVE